MFNHSKIFITVVTLSLSLASHYGMAQPGGNDGGHPPQPPQEAIDACASLSENDSCSFEGHRGETVEGVCAISPSDEESLACKPENGRPPRQ